MLRTSLLSGSAALAWLAAAPSASLAAEPYRDFANSHARCERRAVVVNSFEFHARNLSANGLLEVRPEFIVVREHVARWTGRRWRPWRSSVPKVALSTSLYVGRSSTWYVNGDAARRTMLGERFPVRSGTYRVTEQIAWFDIGTRTFADHEVRVIAHDVPTGIGSSCRVR